MTQWVACLSGIRRWRTGRRRLITIDNGACVAVEFLPSWVHRKYSRECCIVSSSLVGVSFRGFMCFAVVFYASLSTSVAIREQNSLGRDQVQLIAMQGETMRYVCVAFVILMAIGSTSGFLPPPGPAINQQTTTQPTPIRGRNCKNEKDCNGISNTYCMHDVRDTKMRCLCLDKKSPKNGECQKYPKGVNATCSEDKHCQHGAHCSMQTNSSSTAKSCMCKEGFHYEDHMCNTGFLNASPSIVSILISISLLWLSDKTNPTF